VSLPPADKVLDALPEGARKALVEALGQGDRWGYRCQFYGLTPKQVIVSHEGRGWRWSDLSSCGFLTPLGAKVARLVRDGKQSSRSL